MIRNLAILACVIALTAVPADAANASETITRFEAQGSETSGLIIASVTDLAFMRPLIGAFQQTNPGISVSYIEDTSNSLDASVSRACADRTFLADLVISSSIAQQVRLVNGGCAREIDSPLAR